MTILDVSGVPAYQNLPIGFIGHDSLHVEVKAKDVETGERGPYKVWIVNNNTIIWKQKTVS